MRYRPPTLDDGRLLEPGEVAAIDRRSAELGVDGPTLMARAGAAVCAEIQLRFAKRPVLVACGPGNNGGDGWVIARLLHAAGWPVQVACSVPVERLKGDAAQAQAAWQGPVLSLDEAEPAAFGLVVDGLFGAGLARDVDGAAAGFIERCERAARPVVAIDIPSGIDGGTGAVRGRAVTATLTVTFVRAKPGHLLLPGRLHAGELVVVDIGTPLAALDVVAGEVTTMTPALWQASLPRRNQTSHKYRFGHAVILGGPLHASGAGRLAALAALHVGAGLVSVAVEPQAIPVYAAGHPELMTRPLETGTDLDRLLADKRLNAFTIGPAAGIGERTAARALAILRAGKACVLDADALTSLAPQLDALIAAIRGEVVLTPHEGEFQRLFPTLAGSRIERARAAARRLGAIMVLKGADTIVAAPDGRTAILDIDAPALATAGSGDVLAGTITGLLAQGVPAYSSALAAVRMHAETGAILGAGLVSSDLPEGIGARLHAHTCRSAG